MEKKIDKRLFFKDYILPAITGVLVILSFAPFLNFNFLIFICLVPLFLSLEKGIISVNNEKVPLLNKKAYRNIFFQGYLAGLIIFAGALYWLVNLSIIGVITGILLYSICLGIFTVSVVYIGRNVKIPFALLAAILWVCLEFIRSKSVLGFTVGSMGYALVPYLSLIQFASYTGILGVSFFVVMINGLVFQILRKKALFGSRLAAFILIFILILSSHIYGKNVLKKSYAGPRKKIALVQGNINQDIKWHIKHLNATLQKHVRLSRSLFNEKVDMVVWSETAIPCFLLHKERRPHLEVVQNLAKELNFPILTGMQHLEIIKERKYAYNSALLISEKGGVIRLYNKIHLVPLVELSPFKNISPALRERLGFGVYSPGNEYTVFTLGNKKFSTLICFEAIFPDLVRGFVLNGAEFLVNITNDAASFGDLKSPYFQHADMLIFRAIENRIGIVRCANNGISMIIDPFGRVLEKTDIFEEAVLVGEVPLRGKLTYYTCWGDQLANACLLGYIGLLILAIWRHRKKPEKP